MSTILTVINQKDFLGTDQTFNIHYSDMPSSVTLKQIMYHRVALRHNNNYGEEEEETEAGRAAMIDGSTRCGEVSVGHAHFSLTQTQDSTRQTQKHAAIRSL